METHVWSGKQLVKLSFMAIWKTGKTCGFEQDNFQENMLKVSAGCSLDAQHKVLQERDML